MKQTYLFAILLCWTTCCLAQFHKCSFVPTDADLKDVYFINKDVGIAVGNQGTIIKSTDGGLFWRLIKIAEPVYFRKVKFFDDKVGIALGSKLFKTIDAGEIWTEINLPNDNFIDIDILDNQTCIVSGQATALLKSVDQGESWEVLVAENNIQSNNRNYDFGFISFINEHIGYTISDGLGNHTYILKTSDGGNSWDTIRRELVSESQQFSVIEAFSFPQEGVGFKAGWYGSLMLKTTNDGLKWNGYPVDDSERFSFGITDFHIEMDQPDAYYICGWGNNIYKSADQGTSWTRMEIEGLSENSNQRDLFHGIFFIDDEHGWVVGEEGTVLTTSQTYETNMNLDIVVFPNPTSDAVTIFNPDCHLISTVRIFNQKGIEKAEYPNQTEISFRGYADGLYYVQVETADGNVVRRVVKR